jgi:hypothetical protein
LNGIRRRVRRVTELIGGGGHRVGRTIRLVSTIRFFRRNQTRTRPPVTPALRFVSTATYIVETKRSSPPHPLGLLMLPQPIDS